MVQRLLKTCLMKQGIEYYFGDIPRCLNQRDDRYILIGASNWEEHDETFALELQRAQDYGITFNKSKREFCQKQITFYGYRFGEGLQPTQEKIQAVQECATSESNAKVRNFLGMTGYLSKFIPRYSSLTKPLRELTRKEAKF